MARASSSASPAGVLALLERSTQSRLLAVDVLLAAQTFFATVAAIRGAHDLASLGLAVASVSALATFARRAPLGLSLARLNFALWCFVSLVIRADMSVRRGSTGEVEYVIELDSFL